MEKKLTRSRNKLLAGVCAGVAEYFGIDATLLRILYAVCTLFSGAFPGLILYIILMVIMPEAEA
ncbi:MAG: PspC domain-containing protein [Paludibacteraceae bacterium]|nr:PspC domain-containing protein [Paludibacteraceae bacterium]